MKSILLVCVSHLVVSDSLWSSGLWPTRLLYPWNSLAKNTGVGSHSLLQGIFPIQGLKPCLLGLLHWWVSSLPLVPPGKPIWYQWSYDAPLPLPARQVSVEAYLWSQNWATRFSRQEYWSGEGNGNPLQYSCLENLVDRVAWWAAIYGFA